MVARDQSASAGLMAVKGTWEDIRVGSLIQGRKGTNDDVWEVIDQRNPAQYDHRTTPWFRVRNRASGEEATIPPTTSTRACTFMIPEGIVEVDPEHPNAVLKLPASEIPPRTPLSDQEMIDLLARELGATEIAFKDRETGIITCPGYDEMIMPRGSEKRAEFIRHLEICHGLDLSAVDITDATVVGNLHGQAHAKTFRSLPGTVKGFPHRHEFKPFVRTPAYPDPPYGDIS